MENLNKMKLNEVVYLKSHFIYVMLNTHFVRYLCLMSYFIFFVT